MRVGGRMGGRMGREVKRRKRVMLDEVVTLVSLISLCDRYDEISTKVYGDPQSTEDMVQLVQFLNTVSLSL